MPLYQFPFQSPPDVQDKHQEPWNGKKVRKRPTPPNIQYLSNAVTLKIRRTYANARNYWFRIRFGTFRTFWRAACACNTLILRSKYFMLQKVANRIRNDKVRAFNTPLQWEILSGGLAGGLILMAGPPQAFKGGASPPLMAWGGLATRMKPPTSPADKTSDWYARSPFFSLALPAAICSALQLKKARFFFRVFCNKILLLIYHNFETFLSVKH